MWKKICWNPPSLPHWDVAAKSSMVKKFSTYAGSAFKVYIKSQQSNGKGPNLGLRCKKKWSFLVLNLNHLVGSIILDLQLHHVCTAHVWLLMTWDSSFAQPQHIVNLVHWCPAIYESQMANAEPTETQFPCWTSSSGRFNSKSFEMLMGYGNQPTIAGSHATQCVVTMTMKLRIETIAFVNFLAKNCKKCDA